MTNSSLLIHFQRITRPLAHHYTDRKNANRIRKKVYREFPELEFSQESVIFDLGLNRGRFSLAFASTGASIIGLEPNPYVFQNAVKLLSKFRNIHLFQAAAVSKTGVYKLYFHVNHKKDPIGFSISSSLKSNKKNIDIEEFHNVIGLEIGPLINSYEKINLMKIDIEGGEVNLFESLIQNSHKIEYLLIELHTDRISGTDGSTIEFRKFIKDNNLDKKWKLDWE
jgi:FkbM family methyltransferase